MLEYIYFVKCPGCDDEHFDFFNEAKAFAMSCLSSKPIITQIEIDRNDFGECTNSCDLGTVWSWEDAIGRESDDTPAKSIFTKDDLEYTANGQDSEFDALDNSIGEDSFLSVGDAIDFLVSDEEEAIIGYEKVEAAMESIEAENKKEILDVLDHIKTEEEEHIEELKAVHERKPVPADMSIKDLVEAMEANEDTVECAGCEELFPKDECFYDEERGWLCGDCEDSIVKCTWCEELYDKSDCKYEVDMGWLCDHCQAAIMSRGEELTFKENSYWDFLDESFNPNEKVNFSYTDLKVTLQGIKRDVDDWDEKDLVVEFTYTKSKDAVANDIWENFITEEDAKDIPGGLTTLEDDAEWGKFLSTHFDALYEKYYDKLLEFYREDATDAFEETSLDDYYSELAAANDDNTYESCARPSKKALHEKVELDDLVELEYPSLTVTLYGEKRAEDDWDEFEHTDSHVFLVPKEEVATAIWENWIIDEDAKDVEGGLDVLEDDVAWENFLETHFDVLFEKYNKQILDYFEDEATEDFRERSQEEYNLDQWRDNADRAYDAWNDERYFGESFDDVQPFLAKLEESDDYRKHLVDCPECGITESFDPATGICIKCGFNI